MGCAGLLTGLYGLAVETYRAGQGIAADMDGLVSAIVRRAIGGSALVMLSLWVAIAAGLIWFVLVNEVQRIEQAEIEWLLEM
ncbi:MAG: hypothetical protein JXB45_01200 [Candidatus Krumholzibacteriota bacterium]|nr:hypothetical protein [Candidatus Krumholzibacteriota bacterium]